MIKTPLSTVIGGAGIWTPEATVINGAKLSFETVMKKLFANGEQGFAYDPNDLTTMFQDAAGTVPVTGEGQPVGLLLDKSKGLVLGNELITNGDFSNGLSGWSVQNGTGVIVNGAARITATSTAQPQLYMPTAFLAGKYVEISVDFMNRTGGTGVFVGFYSVASGVIASVISNNTSSVVKIKASIPLGFDGGLYCRLNSPTAGSYVDFDNVSIKEIAGNHAYQTNAASRPLLQRNSTTGAYYLAFDGSDDFLQTANIDFTTTDKITVFAGGRKLSDAAAGMITELSTIANTNNGSFFLIAPNNSNGNNIGVQARGTVTQAVTAALVAPANFVSTARINIGGDSLNLRLNGKQVASNVGDQGTGNYGNYPLYIGRRGGSEFPFNGQIYSLIGVGRLSTDNETAAIEKVLAKQLGVTLP